MSSQIKIEDITLEDVKVCINIIKIFKKYYEAVAPLSPSERDFIKWIVAKSIESYKPATTTVTTTAEVTEEEEELSKEMLEKIREKYKKPQKT
jgi:hypothetical protein